ncbi:MAG: M1 family peptidase, partial [Saprospiraceae bacterium]|nr:M1 family peptidase [Saprospiraceae bacterium]
YKEYMVYTTKTADYAVDSVYQENGKTIIDLQRVGEMPFPIDVTVVKKDGSEIIYNIPLRIMRGDKSAHTSTQMVVAEDWPWVYSDYKLQSDVPMSEIKSVHIDKNVSFADFDRENNDYKL